MRWDPCILTKQFYWLILPISCYCLKGGNKIFKKLLPWYLLALVVLSLAFIYGCGNATGGGGGGGGGTIQNREGTYNYFGTAASGDAYSWQISDEVFIGTNETLGITVAGTWKALSSGFSKGTINYATPPIPTGESFYFLEFPNTALMVGTSGTTDVVVCAAVSAEFPSDGVYGWVRVPYKNIDLSQFNAYGTFEVSGSGGNPFNYSAQGYRLDETPDTPESGTLTFSNGTITNDSVSMKMCVTPSGLFIADMGASGGMVGGKVPISFNTLEVYDKELVGVAFQYFPNTSDPSVVQGCAAKGRSDGSLRAGHFENIETGTAFGSGFDVTETIWINGTPIIPGVYTATGSLDSGEQTSFKMIISKTGDAQKLLVFGITTDESDGGKLRVTNFLMKER